MKRTKERDRESEKTLQPDKLEVICPLIFKLTRLAINYDLAWQPETKITVEDDDSSVVEEVTGCWKSNPVQRGHTEVFQQELQRTKDAEEVSWNEKAYYFTHREGVEAREAYEKEVLEGKIRAHITSWGPNPKRANDKSRFHKFTGVTFEELTEKYPDLYSPQPKASTEPKTDEEKESVTVSKKEIKEVVEKTDQEEPTTSALEHIEEEERVAGATRVDETIEDLIDPSIDNEEDDHSTIVLYVSEDMIAERIDVKNESIAWRTSDNEEMQAYLMELPELDTEMWLSPGKWTINGQSYEIRIQD